MLRLQGYPFHAQCSSDLHCCHFFRRTLKILCGVEAIRKTESGVNPSKKVQCLKLLFEYIREPYITSCEIKRIIRYLGRNDISEELVQKIGELFETYFPESARPFEVRSLKHLSRLKLRESLKSAGTYPQGVETLDIPHHLKPYIVIDYKPSIPTDLKSHIYYDIVDDIGDYYLYNPLKIQLKD